MNESCHSCRFWDESPDGQNGLCRIEPPIAGLNGKAVWPITEADDWCGQHDDTILVELEN